MGRVRCSQGASAFPGCARRVPRVRRGGDPGLRNGTPSGFRTGPRPRRGRIPQPRVAASAHPGRVFMSDLWLVLRKFVTNARTVATVAPSSRALARAILRGTDWAKTKGAVELGAGTGPITAQLAEVVPPHVRLVVNEYLPEFCQALRQK